MENKNKVYPKPQTLIYRNKLDGKQQQKQFCGFAIIIIILNCCAFNIIIIITIFYIGTCSMEKLQTCKSNRLSAKFLDCHCGYNYTSPTVKYSFDLLMCRDNYIIGHGCSKVSSTRELFTSSV